MEHHHARILPDDFRAFSQTLEGKVRSRHHAEYASWYFGTAWNKRDFQRCPEYIVRVASIDDVIKSIEFARSHRLGVAVKGSGHSYAGSFLRRGGLLLDMSALNEIRVAAEQRITRAGPGVTSAQLSTALGVHGLAFPTGHGANVGIGGFLLGGGLGINCDAWGGMSTFNILALDVVMADGRLLHLSDRENSDLFWAARGGGPCLFFVVVCFHLRCWPSPKVMLARNYALDPGCIAAVLATICEDPLDHRVQPMIAIGGDTGLPASFGVTAFCDDQDTASRLLNVLQERLESYLGACSSAQLASFEPIYQQTRLAMVCRRYRADNFIGDNVVDLAEGLLHRLAERPSASTFALLIPRPPHALEDAAYSVRGRLSASVYAQWNEEADDVENNGWLRSVHEELASVAPASYINEFDLEAWGAQVSRCFSAEAWERLQVLRRRYDPHNVFPDVDSLVDADRDS